MRSVRSAAGAGVLKEPIDQPWGPRDCAFRDPAGNLFRINELPLVPYLPAPHPGVARGERDAEGGLVRDGRWLV